MCADLPYITLRITDIEDIDMVCTEKIKGSLQGRQRDTILGH